MSAVPASTSSPRSSSLRPQPRQFRHPVRKARSRPLRRPPLGRSRSWFVIHFRRRRAASLFMIVTAGHPYPGPGTLETNVLCPCPTSQRRTSRSATRFSGPIELTFTHLEVNVLVPSLVLRAPRVSVGQTFRVHVPHLLHVGWRFVNTKCAGGYGRCLMSEVVRDPNGVFACPRCGRPVTYKGRGRRPVWCSAQCRVEASIERRGNRMVGVEPATSSHTHAASGRRRGGPWRGAPRARSTRPTRRGAAPPRSSLRRRSWP